MCTHTQCTHARAFAHTHAHKHFINIAFFLLSQVLPRQSDPKPGECISAGVSHPYLVSYSLLVLSSWCYFTILFCVKLTLSCLNSMRSFQTLSSLCTGISCSHPLHLFSISDLLPKGDVVSCRFHAPLLVCQKLCLSVCRS